VTGIGDVARALGWHSVPVPGPAVGLGAGVARRLSFLSPQLEWATALRTPVLMDTAKARRELGWEPEFDAAETLLQTAVAAREEGLLD
jgi:nucleoside-diphosphate-sugar epimerase